jgi:cytochrome c
MDARIRRALPLAMLLAVAAGMAVAQDKPAGDAARGRSVFDKRCITCHVNSEMGPKYRGLIGRKAGTVAGFDYSKALQESGIVWSEELIDRWLTNPDKLVPGNLMGFRVRDAQERADIVAYLKTRV